LELTNVSSEITSHLVAVHPQKPENGNRIQFRAKDLYLEFEDASSLKVDEKITLMKWCNALITHIEPAGDGLFLKATLMEDDKDFKSTKKINWLPKCQHLTEVDLVEYDHLINAKKIDEDMDFLAVLNENSRFSTAAFADPNIKNLSKSDIVQFERRGYYIVDKIHKIENDITHRKMEMIYIPDGRAKTMSNLSTKVDVGKMAKGKTMEKEEKPGDKKEEVKEEAKENPDKKKKEKTVRPPKPDVIPEKKEKKPKEAPVDDKAKAETTGTAETVANPENK